MSHSLASAQRPQALDAIFLWLAVIPLSFALLPAWSLDYGLFGATREEVLHAYGWSGINISLLWLLLPCALLLRPRTPASRKQRGRHLFDAGYALFCMLFMLLSATVVQQGMGYATIGIFIALGAIMTLAMARLEWLGGDRFVIGSLITIIVLIGIFILYPSIAIFIPMFTNSAGEFVPLGFMTVLGQSHILRVIWNSFLLAMAVGFGCTFFGWCWRFTPRALPSVPPLSGACFPFCRLSRRPLSSGWA